MLNTVFYRLQLGRSDTIPDAKYTLGDRLSLNLTSAKDMKVTIDNKLSFNAHVFIITGKARARAYLIHKCFVFKDTKSLVRGFVTYVRPVLEYASSTWPPSTNTKINKSNSTAGARASRGTYVRDIPCLCTFL